MTDDTAASPVMTKAKAGLVATASAATGLVYGPLLVQAAIVAVLVAVVAVVGLAHAHDMTVGRAAALYGGRAIVAVFKAATVVLVVWPLRHGHRAWTRFDLTLRLQLAAVRAGHRAGGRVQVLRRGFRPLPGGAEVLTAGPAPAQGEDRTLTVVRRGA